MVTPAEVIRRLFPSAKWGNPEWQEVKDVLAEEGLVVVSACVCGQPIGVCHSCGQPRCWQCDPGLGKHHQPMRCNGRHEPAALPERTENA